MTPVLHTALAPCNAGEWPVSTLINPKPLQNMPEPETMERVRADRRRGASPSTQAGEFVREEIHHIREGLHGARSTRQAIAIGLSKARRAGVKLPPPAKGRVTKSVRSQAMKDYQKGQASPNKPPSTTRSRATLKALRREGHAAGSSLALSRQAHSAAKRRSASDRSQAARKAARTRKMSATRTRK